MLLFKNEGWKLLFIFYLQSQFKPAPSMTSPIYVLKILSGGFGASHSAQLKPTGLKPEKEAGVIGFKLDMFPAHGYLM